MQKKKKKKWSKYTCIVVVGEEYVLFTFFYQMWTKLIIESAYDFFVVLDHVLVAPSPNFPVLFRTVARPSGSFLHHAHVGRFQVVRQSEPGERVDKSCAEIQSVIAEFGRFVVPRKRVMIVVPPFAERQQCHCRVFRGRDVPAKSRHWY